MIVQIGFIYVTPKMPKGKCVRAQMKACILRVYDYFGNLEQRGGGRGVVYWTSEATGELTSYCCTHVQTFTASPYYVGYPNKTFKRVWRERAASGMDILSPANSNKSSRQQTVVDDFDRGAIRRRIYQLYNAKENLTLS